MAHSGRTALVWIMETGAALALAGMFVILAVYWTDLPERVPRHYGARGLPDAWGAKGTLWLVPVVGAFIYGLLSVIATLPAQWNLPAGDRSHGLSRGLILQFLAALKLVTLTVFAYVTWRAVRISLGQAEGLGIGFIPAVLVLTIGLALTYAVRLRRFRTARKNHDWDPQ